MRKLIGLLGTFGLLVVVAACAGGTGDGGDADTQEAYGAETEIGIDSLEGRMAVPGFYDDGEASNQVVRTHEELKAKLKALYEEWEELAQKATAFS